MEKIILISIFMIVSCALFNNINGALNLFYPSFLTEANCSGSRAWTTWFNIGKPNNLTTGDSENTALILSQNPKIMCGIPSGIHAQSINYRTGSWKYGWRWAQATEIVAFVSFYSTEPVGVDFQVRYCCSKEMLLDTTTTTTTTPIPLDNLTCGKQEIPPRSNLTARIFGGTSAAANSWPWLINYKQVKSCSSGRCYTICGATLIDKDYVITAAHCVSTTNPPYITLTAGMYNQSSTTETNTRQVRTVQQIHIHPEYDSLIVTNDIALLRVSTSFVLTKYVQPACLPGGEPQPNDQVTIIGWGSEVLGGTLANTIKQAITKVIDNCDTYWPQVDNSRQICVANSVSGDSACQGDSGGPILFLFKNQYVVSGVASYVKDCNTLGNSNKPNVYTRVSAYKPWIKSIIG